MDPLLTSESQPEANSPTYLGGIPKRTVKLPSQLDVTIISKPQQRRVFVALDVEVGAFHDPPEHPGLSHFLEHMLFLSNAGDKEGSFETHLSHLSGRSNACTGYEGTAYSFDHLAKHKSMPDFKDSLGRFALMFVNPIFCEHLISRELYAGDTESLDRSYDLSCKLKDVISQLVNQSHPFSKMGLNCIASHTHYSKLTPVEFLLACTNISKALRTFFTDFYSANNMKLCVEGPYSLDQMEHVITHTFSVIPNRNVIAPTTAYSHIPLLLPEYKPVKVLVRHASDSQPTIRLQWMTGILSETEVRDIQKALESECEGSLSDQLVKRQWIIYLCTVLQTHKTFSEFSLSMDLTTKGIDHVDHIIKCVYAYIGMLRLETQNRNHWSKLSTEELLLYMNGNARLPSDSALELCNHNAVQNFNTALSYLCPERCITIVVGEFLNPFSSYQCSPVFNVPYKVEPISEETLQMWIDFTSRNNKGLVLSQPKIGSSPRQTSAPERAITTEKEWEGCLHHSPTNADSLEISSLLQNMLIEEYHFVHVSSRELLETGKLPNGRDIRKANLEHL